MSDNNSKSMGDLFPDLGPEAPVLLRSRRHFIGPVRCRPGPEVRR